MCPELVGIWLREVGADIFSDSNGPVIDIIVDSVVVRLVIAPILIAFFTGVIVGPNFDRSLNVCASWLIFVILSFVVGITVIVYVDHIAGIIAGH